MTDGSRRRHAEAASDDLSGTPTPTIGCELVMIVPQLEDATASQLDRS
jgi:hypothetical protein